MKTIRLYLVLPLAVAALAGGCISTEQTVYHDQERMKVEFENDAAGRLFYEALSKMSGRQGKSESNTQISIPVVFSHKRRVVDGENKIFNDGVRRCDTNADGKITEQEARIFAELGFKEP